MNEGLIDAFDRERFRTEWGHNFAVSANAGSGKTTAISARLAYLARLPESAPLLAKTAVVTFTNKAAVQIGQRARAVLLRELAAEGANDLSALDRLEQAFFGTIHSFCLLLARRYGQNLGIHLNPTVIADEDETAYWEEFVEDDAMEFTSLSPAQVSAFVRHVPLEALFGIARELRPDTARNGLKELRVGDPPLPDEATLASLLSLIPSGNGRKNMLATQQAAKQWAEDYKDAGIFLPPFEPIGNTASMKTLAEAWMLPLKQWLGDAAMVLAAELALRYRAFRLDRGLQTYADQVEGALAVLQDEATLNRIRREGWRIILDEAQDTDAQQFAVLAEIARPPGAPLHTWPDGGGAPPRAGHFCLVGDGQQAIYRARADIRNFLRHLAAYARGEGGDLLKFLVSFRTPRRVVNWLNAGLPHAFGKDQLHNLGLPPSEGAPPPLLQVRYEQLAVAPGNGEGNISIFSLTAPDTAPRSVDSWLDEEVRQLARFLKQHGPASVGAKAWGEICLVAPRNDWLSAASRILEAEGFKVALQTRRQKLRQNVAFAWMTGLLAVLADPENQFEWFGVLREIFAVSDALLASELKGQGNFRWDEPEEHPEPLRAALLTLRPFILSADDEGVVLTDFIRRLANDAGLAARLAAIDPSGAYEEELNRLFVASVEFGREGGGVRGWLRQLLAERDRGRSIGKPEDDAINLLTAHSAKGLEWPVVIPLGLWRRIGKAPDRGLRLIASADGGMRVFLDSGSVPADTQASRDREHVRELVRLLYVTLTRVQRHLVIPWHGSFGQTKGAGASFAELWGSMDVFASLLPLEPPVFSAAAQNSEEDIATERLLSAVARVEIFPLPERLLPHQLGRKPDAIRAGLHEATQRDTLSASSDDDAIEYGLWWHGVMELLPWNETEAIHKEYLAQALATAAPCGFIERARVDLERLKESPAWIELCSPRWVRRAELAVFAPVRENAWVDGVIDLILHDAKAGEVWIVDWKTNRRRAHESPRLFLERLREEYLGQLTAYGACVAPFFVEERVRLWVYGAAVGDWIELTL